MSKFINGVDQSKPCAPSLNKLLEVGLQLGAAFQKALAEHKNSHSTPQLAHACIAYALPQSQSPKSDRSWKDRAMALSQTFHFS